jgi:outer membrane protein OmpA-like peptidoglycan-associated protein
MPLGGHEDPRRGTGLWFDLAGGGGFTGSDLRGSFELGAGYGFALGSYDIGPSLRYVHVVEPNSGGLSDSDAQLLLVGLRVTLFDARPEEAPPPPPTPGDRDFDRILDPDDSCPDEPEDYDGFEDQDGCPDPDNDADGILDPDDSCPDEAEDFDGFEDEDGCPDPDNDADGFLDPDDACPDEAEVINGVDDDDGCPDEGLIEMVDDRIILEERVLFDFERARVKHQASPVLAAIVNLIGQHPEWSRLRIEGHADVRGAEPYNQRLSERRARNVMRALVRLGVPQESISSVGYGSTHPRDLHRTELAHQRNRRVEFVVLERHPAPAAAGAEPSAAAPPAPEGEADSEAEGAAPADSEQAPVEQDSDAPPGEPVEAPAPESTEAP